MVDSVHLFVHFSSVDFRPSDLITQVGKGRKGSGPSTCCVAADFASLSASFLPHNITANSHSSDTDTNALASFPDNPERKRALAATI